MVNSSKVQDKDFQQEPIHNSFTSPIHKNRVYLTPLQQRIVERMLDIHEKDDRAVSYKDFKDISHDVIRHEFSQLQSKGVIETATQKRTIPAWYKVKGISIKWDAFTTRDRVGKGKGVIVSQPIQDIINSFPYGPECAHNIRFRFFARDIYQQLKALHVGKYNHKNDQILLGPYQYTQYRDYSFQCSTSDQCQTIIGCSVAPIRLDTADVMTIPSMLSQLRGQLLVMTKNLNIPTWDRWTCIYQEVGRDSTIVFESERFNIQSSDLIGAYTHFYAKNDWPDGKTRIRKERQEAPNQPALDAITEYRADFVKASQM